jgi:hypothetical protein
MSLKFSKWNKIRKLDLDLNINFQVTASASSSSTCTTKSTRITTPGNISKIHLPTIYLSLSLPLYIHGGPRIYFLKHNLWKFSTDKGSGIKTGKQHTLVSSEKWLCCKLWLWCKTWYTRENSCSPAGSWISSKFSSRVSLTSIKLFLHMPATYTTQTSTIFS